MWQSSMRSTDSSAHYRDARNPELVACTPPGSVSGSDRERARPSSSSTTTRAAIRRRRRTIGRSRSSWRRRDECSTFQCTTT